MYQSVLIINEYLHWQNDWYQSVLIDHVVTIALGVV